jgi:hypothetical protein
LRAMNAIRALTPVTDHHQPRFGFLQHAGQNLDAIDRTLDGAKV